MVQAFSPDFIAPVVGYLTSRDSTQTYGMFEISGGWVAAVRWQRAYGYAVSPFFLPVCGGRLLTFAGSMIVPS